MKRRTQLAAVILLAPSLALAQHRAHSRSAGPGLWNPESECPLEVSVSCAQRCGQGGDSADCPLAAFGCDFKICWADPHVHVVRTDLVQAVGNPASYALADGTILSPSVNAVSVVRFTASTPTTLYFMRDRFVLDIDGLATPEHGREVLRWAQACIQLFRSQPPARTNPDAVYRVACGTDRVALRLLPAAPPAAVAAAPAPVLPAPGNSGHGLPFERLRGMSDRELQTYLEATGHFRVDGSGRPLLDEIVPFSPGTTMEDQQRVYNALPEEARSAFKEFYYRTQQRVVGEAQQSHPAPDGQVYRYNPDSGQAELIEDEPIKGV